MNDIANDDPLASFRLDDRLIVVTGASEGIGRAFAESFARAGASIVLASRRRDKLEEDSPSPLSRSPSRTGIRCSKPTPKARSSVRNRSER
jgi:NAD(P)-dependent dehydrogenase (short-subunit alcohol dehydrogenase family)